MDQPPRALFGHHTHSFRKHRVSFPCVLGSSTATTAGPVCLLWGVCPPQPLDKGVCLYPCHMPGLCPHLLGLYKKSYFKALRWCWAWGCPARDECCSICKRVLLLETQPHRRVLSSKQIASHQALCDSPGQSHPPRAQEGSCLPGEASEGHGTLAHT